jgi:hypothetical protein
VNKAILYDAATNLSKRLLSSLKTWRLAAVSQQDDIALTAVDIL